MYLHKKITCHAKKITASKKILCAIRIKSILLLYVLAFSFSGCAGGASSEARQDGLQGQPLKEASEENFSLSLSDIPVYSGSPYVELEENLPSFTAEEVTTKSFEEYSELDNLGRCGVAYANICQELMPEEKREGIGHIRPSGWHTVKYPEIIKDNYLYNRCHLIGFQLAGENANEKNLITGTRYFNVDGMLPFEEQVADYVRETGNHVLYRVTPVYDGDNLVANGVAMEAWSVEDSGEGICFHVFVYNVQPGIGIDYATGESWLEDADAENIALPEEDADTENIALPEEDADTENIALPEEDADAENIALPEENDGVNARSIETAEQTYILNTNTMKFHKTDCSSVKQIKEENKEEYTGTREALIKQGYASCGNCNP